MELKQGESVISLFLKINLSTTIPMKRSGRELSIDVVIHMGIFKNSQIRLLPCFASIPTTEVSFHRIAEIPSYLSSSRGYSKSKDDRHFLVRTYAILQL